VYSDVLRDQATCPVRALSRDAAQRLEAPSGFESGHIAYVDQSLVGLIAIVGQIIAAHQPIGRMAESGASSETSAQAITQDPAHEVEAN
jgi:hypothetical protein